MDAVHHSRTHPTSASAMEQLQSLLKQKEGELANAQVYTYTYDDISKPQLPRLQTALVSHPKHTP